MQARAHQVKISATITPTLLDALDRLVLVKEYVTRSAAIEAAVSQLLHTKMDALIEAEVSKLNRQTEMAEAEWGMDDYAKTIEQDN